MDIAPDDRARLNRLKRKARDQRRVRAEQEWKELTTDDLPAAVPFGPLNQILGLLGSALLILGAFAPVVSVPFHGSITYFNNGHGDGVIVASLGAISLLLALAQRFRWLVATGGLSLFIVAVGLLQLVTKISDTKAGMDVQLSGNLFRGLAEAAMESIQVQWGWALLLIGALLVMAAAIRFQRKA